jgi:regulator of sigma E protease
MDYVYALLGFVALIILHEAGHFTAAKAVGMRVERFCLFFPPLVVKVRRGETEYGIGAISSCGDIPVIFT